jgi:uncharacterized protein YndB with AHSA1/START domain
LTGHEFVYRHVHRASPELLFECMTNPEHLSRFWGPAGMITPLDGIVVDLRPGGTFVTQMVSTDGERQHRMHAVYETIVRPHRLAWREVASGMLTTVTFVDLGDGTTEVSTHQQGVPDDYISPEARAGWQSSLDRYAAYVETLAEGHDLRLHLPSTRPTEGEPAS